MKSNRQLYNIHQFQAQISNTFSFPGCLKLWISYEIFHVFNSLFLIAALDAIQSEWCLAAFDKYIVYQGLFV